MDVGRVEEVQAGPAQGSSSCRAMCKFSKGLEDLNEDKQEVWRADTRCPAEDLEADVSFMCCLHMGKGSPGVLTLAGP